MNLYDFIPYTRSIGLDIGIDYIRLVMIKKCFGKVSLVKYAKEPLSDQDSDPLSDGIHRLMTQLKIRRPEVHVALASKYVRTIFFDMPSSALAQPEKWIARQIRQRSPILAQQQDLSITSHITMTESNMSRVLAAYCRNDSLKEYITALENAGCTILSIGAGSLDFVNAFAFDTSTFFQPTVLYVYDEKIRLTLTVLKNGQFDTVQIYTHINSERNNESIIKQWIEDYQERNQISMDSIITIDTHDTDFNTSKPAYPFSILTSDKKYLPAEYSLAAGLAAKPYLPFINNLDFLPGQMAENNKTAAEKRWAMRTVLGMGGFLLISMFLLNILHAKLDTEAQEAEEHLLSYNEQLYKMDMMNKQNEQMNAALEHLQKLILKRSRMALYMEEISSRMSQSTWLEKMEIKSEYEQKESVKENRRHVLLQGWSKHADHVAELLWHIEESPLFYNSRLIQTRRISPEDVWRRSKLVKHALVHFTIAMDIKYD